MIIEEKEAIKQAVRLTDLISQYTSLKGRSAHCPFHDDRNPSLSFNNQRGLWYCHGCHLGGDIFNFLMLAEGIGFSIALKRLAEIAGIPLPEMSQESWSQFQFKLTQRKQKLQAIERKKAERLYPLKKSDEFLGGLWKRTNASDWKEREKILEQIEGSFFEIDEAYGEIERWFNHEREKLFRQKIN